MRLTEVLFFAFIFLGIFVLWGKYQARERILASTPLLWNVLVTLLLALAGDREFPRPVQWLILGIIAAGMIGSFLAMARTFVALWMRQSPIIKTGMVLLSMIAVPADVMYFLVLRMVVTGRLS